MCTLTWKFNALAQGYALFFNRDELKTRQRALPPALHQTIEGVKYLAPTDADAGGTWLAVNEYGLTVCLLNNYTAPEPTNKNIVSRGEVVVALAGCANLSELEIALSQLELKKYRGFELVVFAVGVHHWSWDTLALVRLPAEMPITSSSFDTDTVQAVRREFFDIVGADGDLESLKHFHSCHLDHELHEIDGQPLAVTSVCMHRELAQTVSQCFVQVRNDAVSISYMDGSPCVSIASEALNLPRSAMA